jgi:hypothetical protein
LQVRQVHLHAALQFREADLVDEDPQEVLDLDRAIVAKADLRKHLVDLRQLLRVLRQLPVRPVEIELASGAYRQDVEVLPLRERQRARVESEC